MTAEPTPLLSDQRIWARAELLPWDQAAFGFPVGRLLLDPQALAAAELTAAQTSLHAWASNHKVALAAAMVPATALEWMMIMPLLGFTCVDLALSVNLARLSQRPRTIRPATLRSPVPEDHAAIKAIAGNAFDFGRYHRDPRFPRALADRRFARWVEQALIAPTPDQRFLVSGPAGAPNAFMFFTAHADRADWHLAAVARTGSTVPGPMLFAGALEQMEQEGVRQVSSRISAANTSVLNIYAALGFRCLDPEYTFHWLPTDSVLRSHAT